jgi:1-acyl-sn-glycerol-3-phosphate acyltransferase
VLVVGNHLSALDPFIIQAHFPRFIHWMVAKEYYEYPLFKWFLKPLDVIPVNRGSKEPGPLRVALRMLKEGKVVGIFPEATWATGTEVLPFEPGASVLAQRPGVTTFLAALDGTVRNTTLGESLLQPMEVRLMFEEWTANVSQERIETKKMKKSAEDEKKIVAPDPLQQAMIRMVTKLRSHG